ncbi:hypothetical protein ACJMK2_016568 [Sinanodonta woodiana]|uniref:Major facilitator superfamily (MFS) profile domain-containing protein n=1 Tax=Sinanodonta woodiana TaxID=1069815 RepID=A0ABD3UXL0_SINWO
MLFAVGLTSTTIPMYLAECTPPHIRGRLVSTHIAMVAGGQFIASVLDGIFGWDKKNGWRYMLGLAGIPAFVQFVGFIFMPESPRWLITSGQEVKARRVLQAMRGQLDIDEEFESIKNSCHEAEQAEHVSGHKPVIVQMLQTPAVRRALLIGCGLQIIQQVVGINTVLYYSATIIHMTGVKGDEAAIWLAAVTACAYFLFTVLGLYLVEKIGRRALTLGSLMGAIVSLGWLAVGFQLSSQNTPQMTLTELPVLNSTCGAYSTCNQCMLDLNCGFCYVDNGNAGISNSSCLPADYDNPWNAKSGRCKKASDKSDVTWAYDYCPTPYSWMPMVGLILYLVFFAPGMGPMPWTINSEIYPLWARSTGNAAATFCNWVFNLAVSMSFISMTETLTRFGTFLLYAGLACIGLLVLFLLLPETKGKTLEEVEGVFAQPWCGGVHTIEYNTKTIQYVHIRGLNRDGRESELDSPE